jgi:hypothetical protein
MQRLKEQGLSLKLFFEAQWTVFRSYFNDVLPMQGRIEIRPYGKSLFVPKKSPRAYTGAEHCFHRLPRQLTNYSL